MMKMITPESDEIAKISKEIALYELIGKQYGKSNNDLSNLALMTRSEHARLHAIEANKTRRRNERGQYL